MSGPYLADLGFGLAYFLAALISKRVKLNATATSALSGSSLLKVLHNDAVVALLGVGGAITARSFSTPLIACAIDSVLYILALLGLAELYYFRRTGSHGDAFLLRQIVSSRRDLAVAVRYRPFAICLFTTALVAVLIIPIVSLVALSANASPAPSALVGAALLLAGLLLALLPRRPVACRYHEIGGSLPSLLLRDFFCAQPWQEGAVVARQAEQARPAARESAARSAVLPGRPPNVILIVLESARNFSHLPPGTMPFLEALAGRGATVEEMYACVPHTTKALVPILTGLYPLLGAHLPADFESLPAALGEQGYRTAFFTPADLQFERKGDMLARCGFQHLFGAADLDAAGSRRSHYLGYSDEEIYAAAADWLRGAKAGPFFLTVLTLSSHHPYIVPEGLGESLDERGRYLASLGYADSQLGRFHAGLDSAGLLDDTLFMVVGDHGQAFGEHGRWYHSASLWDEVLRVPCVIAGPNVPAGLRIEGVRSQLDLAPTILELAGLAPAGSCDGMSLMTAADPDRELFATTWIEKQSIALRRGALKYIYHYGREPAELYDTGADVFERSNLADRSDRDVLEQLTMDCLVWKRQISS